MFKFISEGTLATLAHKWNPHPVCTAHEFHGKSLRIGYQNFIGVFMLYAIGGIVAIVISSRRRERAANNAPVTADTTSFSNPASKEGDSDSD